MRTNTELAAIGIAAVYLAFFSWPVPRIIKDIFHTGVGRLLGLLGVAYLAKQQSAALAIIAAIFYVKSTYAAYHENFTEGFNLRQYIPNPTQAQEDAAAAALKAGKTPDQAIAAARAAAGSASLEAASGSPTAPPHATSGNVPASSGSTAAVQPSSSHRENFEAFSGF